jgi:hypothetical protein
MKKKRKCPRQTHPQMKNKTMMKIMRMMSSGYRRASPFGRLMPKGE